MGSRRPSLGEGRARFLGEGESPSWELEGRGRPEEGVGPEPPISSAPLKQGRKKGCGVRTEGRAGKRVLTAAPRLHCLGRRQHPATPSPHHPITPSPHNNSQASDGTRSWLSRSSRLVVLRLRFVPKSSREARGGRPDLRPKNRSRSASLAGFQEQTALTRRPRRPPERELEGHQVPREQRAPLLLEG